MSTVIAENGRSLLRSFITAFVLPWFLVLANAGSAAAQDAVIDHGALITMSPTGDPDTQAAIRLAVMDVEAYFAAQGRPRDSYPYPRLTIEGTGLDPDVALEKIQSLVRQGVRVVIGPESSAEVERIKPFTDVRDVVLLSHCSTAPSLAIPGDSVYRLVPSDLRQAAAIANLISAHGYDTIIPMWREGVWGDDISAAFREHFEALGGTVYPGVRFDADKSDFTADVDALEAQVATASASSGNRVAVAFFAFGTEGAAVLAEAAASAALGSVAWFGSDGTAHSREIAGDPLAAQFAVKTGFFNTLMADVQTPRANAVRQRISEAIGGGVHYCAMAAYDAVWLAFLASEKAGRSDAAQFKLALTQIAEEYEGVTGMTKLDAAGDRAEAAYAVWAIRVENGEYVWRPVSSQGTARRRSVGVRP